VCEAFFDVEDGFESESALDCLTPLVFPTLLGLPFRLLNALGGPLLFICKPVLCVSVYNIQPPPICMTMWLVVLAVEDTEY
jgi:hypothetical protein